MEITVKLVLSADPALLEALKGVEKFTWDELKKINDGKILSIDEPNDENLFKAVTGGSKKEVLESIDEIGKLFNEIEEAKPKKSKPKKEAPVDLYVEEKPAKKKAITLEMLREVAEKYILAKGTPNLLKFYSDFGAKKLTDLDKADYASFYEALTTSKFYLDLE